MPRKSDDMIGKVYGVLLIIEKAVVEKTKGSSYLVKCLRCNKEKVMNAGNIRRVIKINSFNGGCKCNGANPDNTGMFKPLNGVHNMSSHPAYSVWSGMLTRCYSEGHVAYHRYGGRGIDVCKEWKESVIVFLKWIDENKWSKGMQIDRIDNNKGYSPDNCRIVSGIENQNNKENNRILVIDNEQITLSNAARKYGILVTTLRERLRRGWSVMESVGLESPPVKIVSDETKRKLSEAKKNQSEETRRKISEAHKGKVVSLETREKLRVIRLSQLAKMRKDKEVEHG